MHDKVNTRAHMQVLSRFFLAQPFWHIFFRQILYFGFFLQISRGQTVLAAVTPDQVRHRVNLSSSDISDAIVTEFIVNACAGIELETGRTIDYQNSEEAEASCIRDLAALYCLTYLTGGSASGTSFTLGDLSVREVTGGVETSGCSEKE